MTFRKIPLTRNSFAIVDLSDFKRVSDFNWTLLSSPKISKIKYAARFEGAGKNRRMILMHRFLMNENRFAIKVDHIDGNGLNNRRANLRSCSHAQNIYNQKKRKNGITAKYKGVHLHKLSGKFRSQIRCGILRLHLGLFKTQKEAAQAYDSAAIELFGEFAKLNFKPSKNEVYHL